VAELTDDDIELTAERLVRELDLDEDARNVITMEIQRLVWPPSPYLEFHGQDLVLSEDGHSGELTCLHGCARRWRVNQAPSRDVVFQALADAHTEYRTGRYVSWAPQPVAAGRKQLSLNELVGRTVAIEVTDERITS
jgi:hypothetical protein